MQGELIAKAKLGGLDTVLQGCIAAMIRFLNLFLDGSLSYPWIKASEIITKSKGCGMNCMWSI